MSRVCLEPGLQGLGIPGGMVPGGKRGRGPPIGTRAGAGELKREKGEEWGRSGAVLVLSGGPGRCPEVDVDVGGSRGGGTR